MSPMLAWRQLRARPTASEPGSASAATAIVGRYATRVFVRSLCALSVVLGSPVIAQAQETIDVAKITCDQFLAGRVADSRSVGIWLSGYYNGKRNNTILDVSTLQKNAQEVMDYCITHPKVVLMDAVTTLIGKANK